MLTPPRRSSLTIFPDEYSKPHTCTAVAILAGGAIFHEAVG
jgi:hypothetical protein